MVKLITPLNIQTTYPKVYIDRQLPKVTIDQYECFAEAGLKNNTDFAKECVEYTNSLLSVGIDRIVSEGNRMASIEKRMPDAIPEIAFDNTFDNKDWNIDIMPKSMPKIDVEGYLNLEWEMGKLNFYKESVLNYKKGNEVGNSINMGL